MSKTLEERFSEDLYGIRAEIAGISLHLHPSAYEQAWIQTMAWEAEGFSQKFLQFLTAGRFRTGNFALARTHREPAAGGFASRTYDAGVARGIPVSMLRDAEEEPAYGPSGEFVVRLPANYAFRRWRIAELRVYARPDHFQVMALDEHGKPDTAFRLEPADIEDLAGSDVPPSRWLTAEDAAPLVDVTMAALWRDAAAPSPLPSSKPPCRSSGKALQQARRPQQSRSRTVRHLPRPRRIALGGERDWGD